MPVVKKPKLTKLELEIMDALWDLGEAAVRQVQEALPQRKRPAYTTVQTILQRLEQKGAVRRTRKIGNAYLFEPTVTRRSAYGKLIDDLLEVVGTPRSLMAHLVETGQMSLEDLRELEKLVSKKERR